MREVTRGDVLDFVRRNVGRSVAGQDEHDLRPLSPEAAISAVASEGPGRRWRDTGQGLADPDAEKVGSWCCGRPVRAAATGGGGAGWNPSSVFIRGDVSRKDEVSTGANFVTPSSGSAGRFVVSVFSSLLLLLKTASFLDEENPQFMTSLYIFPHILQASEMTRTLDASVASPSSCCADTKTSVPRTAAIDLMELNKFFVRVYNDIQAFIALKKSGAGQEVLAPAKSNILASLNLLEHAVEDHNLAGPVNPKAYKDVNVRLCLMLQLWEKACRENDGSTPLARMVEETFKDDRRSGQISPELIVPKRWIAKVEGSSPNPGVCKEFIPVGTYSPSTELTSVDELLLGDQCSPCLSRASPASSPSPKRSEGIMKSSSSGSRSPRSPKKVTIVTPKASQSSPFVPMSYLRDFTANLEKRLARLLKVRHPTCRVRLFKRPSTINWGFSLWQHKGREESARRSRQADQIVGGIMQNISPANSAISARLKELVQGSLIGVSGALFSGQPSVPMGRCRSPRTVAHAFSSPEQKDSRLVAVGQDRVKGGAKSSHDHARAPNNLLPANNTNKNGNVSSYIATPATNQDHQMKLLRQQPVKNQNDLHGESSSPSLSVNTATTSKTKPTPDSSVSSSFRVSERIINEGPFGSPGELPTTHGGLLDPANMPPQKSELLPSLSLATSESRSPRRRRKPSKAKSKSSLRVPSQLPVQGKSRTQSRRSSNPLVRPQQPAVLKKAAATSPSPPPIGASEIFLDVARQPPAASDVPQHGKSSRRRSANVNLAGPF